MQRRTATDKREKKEEKKTERLGNKASDTPWSPHSARLDQVRKEDSLLFFMYGCFNGRPQIIVCFHARELEHVSAHIESQLRDCSSPIGLDETTGEPIPSSVFLILIFIWRSNAATLDTAQRRQQTERDPGSEENHAPLPPQDETLDTTNYPCAPCRAPTQTYNSKPETGQAV